MARVSVFLGEREGFMENIRGLKFSVEISQRRAGLFEFPFPIDRLCKQ